MKYLKKSAALLLALIMILALSAPALAATTYSITISNPVEGDTYSAYKIFDATTLLTCTNTEADHTHSSTCYDASHTTYTIAASPTASSWLEDVKNYTAVTKNVASDGTVTWTSGTVQENDGVITGKGLTLTKSADGTCYVVTAGTYTVGTGDDAVTKNFSAADFAEYLATKATGKTATATTQNVTANTDGSKTISLTEPGYYLVTCAGATHTTALAELTTTNPTATIIDKNKVPFDKTITNTEVTGNGVQVGDVVNFEVTGMVPSTSGFDPFTYIVTDKMSEGLTFNYSTIELTVDNNVKTNSDTTTYYTLNEIHATKDTTGKYDTYYLKKVENTTKEYYRWNEGTGWNDTAETNNLDSLTLVGFVMNINMATLQDNVGKTIKIAYSATVNDNAVAVVSQNEATLDYSNDPGTIIDMNPEVENVYSSKIVISKFDANTATSETTDGVTTYTKIGDTKYLENAEFVLYRYAIKDSSDSSNPTYSYYDAAGVAYNKDTTTEETNKSVVKRYYKYTAADTANNTPAKVEWIDEGTNGAIPADATKKTTYTNGTADFQGLEDGTYYLLETKAPDGYNLLKDPVGVTVDGDKNGTVTEANLTITEDVANNAGSLLPSTGGMGTTIFYIVGAILVLGAAVLLITRRRMNADK